MKRKQAAEKQMRTKPCH